VLVLQGAKKRLATRSSFFYLHPFSISFEKEPIVIDGKSERKFFEKIKAAKERQRMFYEILIKRAKLSLKEIKALQEKIIFAQKAKEIGLIDGIIEEEFKIPF
jgi:ATP-dependent protease ClpP protease subunit